MRYSFAALIVVVGLFFILMGSVFRYRAFLAVVRFFHGDSVLDYETMRAENAALRNALSAIASAPAVSADKRLIFANVFAEYPFNGRALVRVDKGQIDGMRVGYPATFGGSVLAGQITAVGSHYAVVRMVGSPDWQIPVRVGPHKIAGLLVGGPVPRISMVPADKVIAAGDAIIAASGDLPYGLTVGTVGVVNAGATGAVFKEASVKFPYDSRDVAELAFIVWIPE